MRGPLVAFGRDWCVVTAQLVPDTETYRRLVERVIVSTRRVWPVLLRPILVGAMIWLKPGSTVFGSVWLVFAFAIGIGFLPRVTVLLPLVTVALAPVGTAMELFLVATGANILVLGSGDFSLYTPEEHWFFGRHGRTAAANAGAAVDNR